MLQIDSFIAEIRSSLKQYSRSGLIEDIDIYDWVIEASKKFGGLVTYIQDTVVEVKNSKGFLPEHFFSLYSAIKVDKKGYNIPDKESVSVLQQSYMWVQKVERSNLWNSCNTCCKEEEEKIITERVYFNEIPVDFYYENPTPLKLGKRMALNSCHKECRNRYIKDCLNEISIIGTTMYTNFKEGDVYIEFYGLPVDEHNKPYVPVSSKGEVQKYISYYVKRNIFEKIISNNDDVNARTLFNYYVNEEKAQFTLALTEVKMLTPNSFNRLKKLNRITMMMYER